MKFNDQKQFIVDRFTKELEDAGLGAYRIEVVRDTNYCFRLASTCYISWLILSKDHQETSDRNDW